MQLVKAKIEILDKEAIDEAKGLPAIITVQFNPTEYTLNKGAQIAEIAIPGIDSPILQFIRGQNEKLTLDLFFDITTDIGNAKVKDVRLLTRAVYQLVKIQPKTHAPPRIRFLWGSLSFKAIVETVQQKFTLFDPSGLPLRATLSVAFREYKTLEDQLKELKPESTDHTAQRVVKGGETLSSIAAEEYDDPRLWRYIADSNEAVASNPIRLTPGTVLLIPASDAIETQAARRR